MNLQEKHKRPIFIVGCTRSGTKLISRIVGGHNANFLITEHREKFHIPEDNSKICEEYIWWNNFANDHWDKRGEPNVRNPVYNDNDIDRVREIFLNLAGKKRLVVKNPQSILRIKILKKMFPNALYIFCVRNPWHGLQSRIISGQAKYLISSQENYNLPDDLLLKSVYSWKESIDIYNQEKDENWCVVKYEDTVFNTKQTLKNLFNFLAMPSKDEYFQKACSVPRDLKHTFYPVKRSFYKSKYKKQILDIIDAGCRQFGYKKSIELLPGNAIDYYLFKKEIVNFRLIWVKLKKIFKDVSKIILKIIFQISGRNSKLYVNQFVFGALARKSTTLVLEDDSNLESIISNASKNSVANFNTRQMQYYRLKNFDEVMIMDTKGVPWILLGDIKFSPMQNHDYKLNGHIKYIKK